MGVVRIREFKAWIAETILSGHSTAALWWYGDIMHDEFVSQRGTPGAVKEEKRVILDLVKCDPSPVKQTVTMAMSMRDLQFGLLMPDVMALIREGVNEEVWYGPPIFLTKPKERTVHLFFTIEGDYD